jgi:iron complex transport system substrate-binding protein
VTAQPRIVSLLPSATEMAVALGLGEQLVGRSHECDFPAWVERLPVCTATKIEKGLTSREIDNRVREIVRQGLSVYEVDTDLLRALKPDMILTQSQCAVCAVTPGDLGFGGGARRLGRRGARSSLLCA